MQAKPGKAGLLSILIAGVSLLLGALLLNGVQSGGPAACGDFGFSCLGNAVAVGTIGGVIGSITALVGFCRDGARSWANWIGLSINLLPVAAVCLFSLLVAMR